MKQRIAPATGDGKPQSADEMAGNKLAGDMAEKAKAAIRATDKVVAASPSARRRRIDAYLDCAITIPDEDGCRGGQRVRDVSDTPTAQLILTMIDSGLIDEETMLWTDKARGQGRDRKICICMEINCRIGPFIPFRK